MLLRLDQVEQVRVRRADGETDREVSAAVKCPGREYAPTRHWHRQGCIGQNREASVGRASRSGDA